MSQESVCLATLFLSNNTAKTVKKLGDILERFEISNADKDVSRVRELSLNGYTIEDIKAELLLPLVDLLDTDKQSSVFFRSDEGAISTILIKDGVLLCA